MWKIDNIYLDNILIFASSFDLYISFYFFSTIIVNKTGDNKYPCFLLDFEYLLAFHLA